MRIAFLLFAPFLFAAAPAPRIAIPPGMAACAIEGWSSDPYPAGLNVRAASDAKAAVVARLPRLQGPQIDGGLVEFQLPAFGMAGS